MYDDALMILKTIEKNGYQAYIVGGYARDKYMGLKSNDIDICTSATPNELKNIFIDINDKYKEYGNVILKINNHSFQITTFREDKYLNDRRNVIIKYVDNLKTDLKRRDFVMNTLCINSDGEYIDLMNAKDDIDKKLIRLVGDIDKLKDDPLRMLRAIRLATILNFKIDKLLDKGIKKYGYLVENLSDYRKSEEINKIINSKNKEYGIKLIIKYNLYKYINNIDLKNEILYNIEGDYYDG